MKKHHQTSPSQQLLYIDSLKGPKSNRQKLEKQYLHSQSISLRILIKLQREKYQLYGIDTQWVPSQWVIQSLHYYCTTYGHHDISEAVGKTSCPSTLPQMLDFFVYMTNHQLIIFQENHSSFPETSSAQRRKGQWQKGWCDLNKAYSLINTPVSVFDN